MLIFLPAPGSQPMLFGQYTCDFGKKKEEQHVGTWVLVVVNQHFGVLLFFFLVNLFFSPCASNFVYSFMTVSGQSSTCRSNWKVTMPQGC